MVILFSCTSNSIECLFQKGYKFAYNIHEQTQWACASRSLFKYCTVSLLIEDLFLHTSQYCFELECIKSCHYHAVMLCAMRSNFIMFSMYLYFLQVCGKGNSISLWNIPARECVSKTVNRVSIQDVLFDDNQVRSCLMSFWSSISFMSVFVEILEIFMGLIYYGSSIPVLHLKLRGIQHYELCNSMLKVWSRRNRYFEFKPLFTHCPLSILFRGNYWSSKRNFFPFALSFVKSLIF